jgi:hypothetical protein
MGLGPAGFHALASLAAIGAKSRTSLDKIIDQIVVKCERGITTFVRGFEQNPLRARGLEDLTDRRLGVTEGPLGRVTKKGGNFSEQLLSSNRLNE